MEISTGKTHCVKCRKDRCTLRCGGCLKDFCFNHLVDHRQELMKQLDEIDSHRDLFRHSLTEQMNEPKNHPLIQQIDQWKCDSIKKIEKTAEEAKQLLITHNIEHFNQIESKLNKLTTQLREIREENDFNEINLLRFQEELERMTAELSKQSNISIGYDSSSFINKIYVNVSSKTEYSLRNIVGNLYIFSKK
jgi:hypothetical protein